MINCLGRSNFTLSTFRDIRSTWKSNGRLRGNATRSPTPNFQSWPYTGTISTPITTHRVVIVHKKCIPVRRILWLSALTIRSIVILYTLCDGRSQRSWGWIAARVGSVAPRPSVRPAYNFNLPMSTFWISIFCSTTCRASELWARTSSQSGTDHPASNP